MSETSEMKRVARKEESMVCDDDKKPIIEKLVEKAADVANIAAENAAQKVIGNSATAVGIRDILKIASEEIVDSAQVVLLDSKDEVLQALRDKAREFGVKKSTLAIVIKFVMEAVEKTPLKGSKQKEYALRLIRALIDDLARGDDKKFLLIALDSGSVADTIDLVAAAAKGDINVNKAVEVATRSCLAALLACCFNQK
jgi:hypothetical protein